MNASWVIMDVACEHWLTQDGDFRPLIWGRDESIVEFATSEEASAFVAGARVGEIYLSFVPRQRELMRLSGRPPR